MTDNALATYIQYLKGAAFHPIQIGNDWWYDAYHQRRVYFSLPLHRQVTPDLQMLDQLFAQKRGTWAVRFIAPLEHDLGLESYMWVYQPPYTLEALSSNTRSKIRRGLRRCQVRPITFKTLNALGEQARQDTLARHGEDPESGGGVDLSMAACPNFEAWGAFVGEALAAYLITLWVENWAHLLVNRSSNEYLRNYPNNALVFHVVRELLARPGCDAVSYGWAPLESHQSLDHFKSSMGAVQIPVRQAVILRPALRSFLRPGICRGLAWAASRFPENSRMQKVAGLCELAAASWTGRDVDG